MASLVSQAAAETSGFLVPVTKNWYGQMNSEGNKKEKGSQKMGVIQRIGDSQIHDLFFLQHLGIPRRSLAEWLPVFLNLLLTEKGLASERWLPSLFQEGPDPPSSG